MSIAGLRSHEMTISQEPALQRKKHIRHNVDSLELNEIGAKCNSDYILLGGSDKFSKNIKYKTREQYKKKHSPIKSNKKKEIIVTPDAPRLDFSKRPQKPGMQQIKFDRRKPKDVPCIDVTTSSDKRELRLLQQKKRENSEVQMNNKDKVKMVSENIIGQRTKANRLKGHNVATNVVSTKQVEKAVNVKETEEDYALRYKVGLKRPLPIKRLSEYQKQFEWRSQPNVTPLLAAEQMIHNNCRQMLAPKQSKMSRHSEYQRQFKTLKSDSRMVEALDLVPAGAPPVTTGDDKRLLQQSAIILPQRTVCSNSEYTTNFQAPCAFNYVRGAWIAPNKQLSKSVNNLQDSSWFREVLELRKRANEYSRRSRGTHFLQSHVGQLFSKNAEIWDGHSSSGISSGGITMRSKSTISDQITDQSTPRDFQTKKLNWITNGEKSEQINHHTFSKDCQSKKVNYVSNNMKSCDDISDDIDDLDLVSTIEPDDDSIEIAKTKPKFIINTKKDHIPHLKLTTPAKHGHILKDTHVNTQPLFGKPTADSQILVNDQNNKPFIGEFISNSTFVTDDDVLSCCSSLASETLALAKDRQNFWTQAY